MTGDTNGKNTGMAEPAEAGAGEGGGIDLAKWEVVFAQGQRYLARVEEIVRRGSVPYLLLCPVFDYLTRTQVDPKDPSRLRVQRQAAPVELMGSSPKHYVPLWLASRTPISSYDPEDQKVFLEMILGARAAQKDAREQPRIVLDGSMPPPLDPDAAERFRKGR